MLVWLIQKETVGTEVPGTNWANQSQVELLPGYPGQNEGAREMAGGGKRGRGG